MKGNQMKYEVKAEQTDYNPTGSFRRGADGWTICFIYPMNEHPFIIKGGGIFVDKWLKDHPNLKAIIQQSIWHKGETRNIETFSDFFKIKANRIYISKREDLCGRQKFFFERWDNHKKEPVTILITRRFPKRFPDQIKKYLKENY